MLLLTKLLNIKVVLSVVAVISVLGIGWFLVNYGRETEKSRIVIEQQENYITTRKRIDNATKNSPSDADSARSRLLDRQINRQ